jgi:DNA-binding transcriptional MerR regulator
VAAVKSVSTALARQSDVLTPDPDARAADPNLGSSDPSFNQLTIEELSRESGMSVRNIRSHQARGLLAPPEVRLRVGYYGPEHVAQLQLIRELQGEGFNLAGIKRLLEDRRGTAERLIRFKRAFTAPLHDERAETLTLAELAERFPVSSRETPEAIAKAQRLGVFLPVGDEQYQVPSPALLAVAEEVVELGISVQGALAILELIEKHCDAVSRAFVELFLREVWTPFQAAGMPEQQWPEIEQSLKRLRPLASEALLAIFQQRISAEVESAVAEVARPRSEGKG